MRNCFLIIKICLYYVDINECEINPCSKYGKCYNTQGSYICQCSQGYSGDGFMCHDINECNMNPGNICGNYSTCINTNGSYYCQCKPGFTGNGLNCSGIEQLNLYYK